jgi:hypothetical protein
MQISFKRYCKTMELLNDPILIEAYKKAHAKGAVWTEITQGNGRISAKATSKRMGSAYVAISEQLCRGIT